jgi:murein DD-endopeptidase MepM/ murein hydrolase activator NlpD
VTALCYPHPKGAKSKSGCLHPTGGLPGNIALDFMAPGGTLVLAVQAGVVKRWSGHDPIHGVYPGAVFGWSMYVDCADGFYFLTHLGVRYAPVGRHVQPGDVLGRVGHWPQDEGRSHTHYGFTAHAGTKAATKRIQAVAAAPRVKAVWPV